MLSTKLLLVFSVLVGIFADQCDLKDIGMTDFADKVTVTNLSDQAEAFVRVSANHGGRTIVIEAGESRSVLFLAATKYTVTVAGRSDYGSYKDQLMFLRSELLDITLSSKATPDDIATAASELVHVQGALEQMVGSDRLQSCGGKLVTDATSHATVKLTELSDGSKVWALDCG